MTYQELLRSIKRKQFKPVYLLHGDEPYYIEKIVEAIEQYALQPHEKSFNLDIVYGKEIDVPTLKSYLMQFPVMAERRVVILKEAADFKQFKELKDYWKSPVPSTVFVVEHKHKKMGAGAKEIAKTGVVFESKKVYENKIPGWIVDYIKEAGRSIRPAAALLLAQFLGNDLSKLANELDKILLNVPEGKEVDADTIEQLVGISKKYNVFELQDALSARDVQGAMRIAMNLAANLHKQPLVLLMSSLYAYFAKIYLVHRHAAQSDAELAKKLGLRFQFHVKNYRKAARAFPVSEVKRCIDLLRVYDLKSKGLDNASATHGELLEELVFKILNPEVHAH